jgi:hypothetical protein
MPFHQAQAELGGGVGPGAKGHGRVDAHTIRRVSPALGSFQAGMISKVSPMADRLVVHLPGSHPVLIFDWAILDRRQRADLTQVPEGLLQFVRLSSRV